jgi:putative endonuclease
MPPRAVAARPRPTVRTPRQRAGDAAEAAAERHLLAAGRTLRARIARYPEGELDLVMRKRDVLPFVKVRLRSSRGYGGATASVDRTKQKRPARAARHWLQAYYGERWPACRFDVVAVAADGTIEWIRDAFAV